MIPLGRSPFVKRNADCDMFTVPVNVFMIGQVIHLMMGQDRFSNGDWFNVNEVFVTTLGDTVPRFWTLGDNFLSSVTPRPTFKNSKLALLL